MATSILAAIAGEMFVDRVIQHLENAVMQTTFVRVADIHSRAVFGRLRDPSSLSICAASYFCLG